MSSTARNHVFSAVQTVGSLLPADMLVRISEGKDVTGSTPADYGIVGGGSVRDEAERHWDYLKGAWRVLREKLPQAAPVDAAASTVPPDPTGLAVGNWLEPLFAELGFGRLQPVPAPGIACDDKTKTFPITHSWAHVPIDLVPWDTDLDRKPNTAGAATTTPPQSLVQELLNRTDAHLWAVLSNGRQLRLLRDSASLVGASYVEFDLEAIFDGELFSEFVLLYRLLHVSRFEVEPGAAPTTCRLEKWRTDAIDSGTRALEQLRDGVQRAITSLGTGFTQHAQNATLRENMDTDLLKKALLRLVYRMLFLFVAEDRNVLIPADADPKARERYERYFSTARLRETARRSVGTTHGDRWETLRRVLDHLRDENGFPALGLPGLGGIFEHIDADAILDSAGLSNEALLTAVRALSVVYDPKAKRNRVIDYRHLGAEELGSIYESLLELVPKYDPADRSFQLIELAGSERKTTGSYYTPTSLIDCLLDSALDPVLDRLNGQVSVGAYKSGMTPEQTLETMLLNVKVCDPACGSGHFLVAAARRIAKRLAAVREGNPEPTLDAVRTAMRDVVAKCIYGVDLNPMAVELAKVSLWLEALEPGKPLGFLDAHVKQGNALLGTTPKLLADGIPDDAFKPIEGDDKKWAAALRKQNEKERGGQDSLFGLSPGIKVGNAEFARSVEKIIGTKANALADVHRQEAAFHDWEQSTEYRARKHVADAWCATFVWLKTKDAPQTMTEAALKALDSGVGVAPETHDEIERIAKEYEFFHWHLEFPDVFHVPEGGGGSVEVDDQAGWSGGFNCVLGNPPWEKVELKEQEFFSQRDAKIATASNASLRKNLIANLSERDSELANEFRFAKRESLGESHFLRSSGRFPLGGRGNINTYTVFCELSLSVTSLDGTIALILPTGVATDERNRHLSAHLLRNGLLQSLYDFENKDLLFPSVDSRARFSLLVAYRRQRQRSRIKMAAHLRSASDMREPSRIIELSAEDAMLLNPNTGTLPIIRTAQDMRLIVSTYQKFPVLVNESADSNGNPWKVALVQGMFNMSHNSNLFETRETLESAGWRAVGSNYQLAGKSMLPLYQGMMASFYDHRAADVVKSETAVKRQNQPRYLSALEKNDPSRLARPMYWVPASLVPDLETPWLVGFSDATNAANERTLTPYPLPYSAIGHKIPLVISKLDSKGYGTLLAMLSCFCLDYMVRQKISGTSMAHFHVKQLPVLRPDDVRPYEGFILSRVLELTYTAYDMEPFARDLGDDGAPFRWDENRRFLLRAELDALFFHLYGINRDDVDHIMETFPIVKRKDVAAHGTYRTKDQILAIYDAMAAATASGTDYQTIITPAPGSGPRHPARPSQEDQ